MADLDELRRLLERGTPASKLHFSEMRCRILSVESIVAAGSDHPQATAIAMIAAYEAAPKLLSELDRLRSRVAELEAKLAEAREVVRPFAGKSAYFAAKSEDIRRAAEWLRRQEE